MGMCQMRYGVVFVGHVRMLRIWIIADLRVSSPLLANSSVERCNTDDLMPNVLISCLPPSCADHEVQGLKVIIDCALPGKSSQATYRPIGGLSAAAMHGDDPSLEWFKQGVQRNSVRSLESENQVGTG